MKHSTATSTTSKGVFVAADSCPLPVRQEAVRRGWHVEQLSTEIKSTANNVRVVVPSERNNSWWHGSDYFVLLWRNSRFSLSEFRSAKLGEKLNHFPNSKVMTKKDLLVRGIRKMRIVHGRVYEFTPQTFILPTEYTKFVQQYAEDEEDDSKAVWICKPSDMSRGRKIFLMKDLSELHYDQQYIIQKYVPNPLTIGGYKLDLRVYVLVTSLHPLRIYMYRDGLARFGTEKYDSDMKDIDNLFAHLTNSSINKHSGTYSEDKDVIGSGAKWNFAKLRAWIEGNPQLRHHGQKRPNQDCRESKDDVSSEDSSDDGFLSNFDLLWKRIADVVILTVLTMLQQKDTDPACSFFELFGFDILVDAHLKPWLLEVNCAPALSIDCEEDANVKQPLIKDLFDLIQDDDPKKDRYLSVKKLDGPTSSSSSFSSSSSSRSCKARLPSSNSGQGLKSRLPSCKPTSKVGAISTRSFSRKPPIPTAARGKSATTRPSSSSSSSSSSRGRKDAAKVQLHFLNDAKPTRQDSRDEGKVQENDRRREDPEEEEEEEEETKRDDEAFLKQTHTNFEQIFPFDQVTAQVALQIHANGLKQSDSGGSGKKFSELVRMIVDQVKRRKQQRYQ